MTLPKRRRRPLVSHLFARGRLYDQLAGVHELGQSLLLLQGRIQVYLPDPVEGGPHRAPLAGFLFDKSPQRSTSCAQRAFLGSHKETPLSLQAPDFQAVLLEPDAKLFLRLLFAAVELYQQPTL